MEKLEKTVDKIALEVLKHTEAIKGLLTKEEFGEFKNENFTRLDNMIVILNPSRSRMSLYCRAHQAYRRRD